MKNEKWTKSPWTVSISTTIISFLLTLANDYFKGKPILTTVLYVLKWVSSFIWSILCFDVKVWWLIVVIIFFFSAFYLYNKFKQDGFKPDFYDYTEDQFKMWTWSWNWLWSNSKNAWMVSNLHAHCPNCNTPMIENSSYHVLSFNCPRCDYHSRNGQCDEPHKVERIILDNIERKRKEQSKQKV